jgi:hypothetical protein
LTVYVTAAELRASLSVGGSYNDAGEDFDLAVETASRAVEKATDRVFYLRDPSNPQTRYYTPIRPMVLDIDDCVALTSLMTDQDGDGIFETTWTLHSDFELQPDNAIADGRPYERIVVKETGSYRFPYGLPRSVEVVGSFGWTTTPSAVKSLARLLATQIVLRAKMAPFGVAGIGVDGAVRIAKEDPAMCMLLRDLDRSPIFA